MFSMTSHTSNELPSSLVSIPRDKQPVTRKSLQPLPNSIFREYQKQQYIKTCEHCRLVYQSPFANGAHCIQCCACGQYKKFHEMAGKAIHLGYVCSDCYLEKPYTRKWSYSLLMRF